MSYLVVLSFDLNANSQDLYDDLNIGLNNMGLKKELRSSSGKTVALPSNTYSGTFTGAEAGKVRDDIAEQIKKIFNDNNAHGRVFLAIGGDSWAWSVQNL